MGTSLVYFFISYEICENRSPPTYRMCRTALSVSSLTEWNLALKDGGALKSKVNAPPNKRSAVISVAYKKACTLRRGESLNDDRRGFAVLKL